MRSKFTWNISARLKETTTRDKHYGLRLVFHVLVCFLAYAFLPTNAFANTCGPPREISGKVHLVKNYLRFYPEPELARANSLAVDDLITGLGANDGHIVYSDTVVNGDDEVMEVVLPIWMHTSRLDTASMTTGDSGYTVGRVYNPDDPTDISNVADGGFVSGANNLPVVAFGCSVSVFTLTYVRGYFYRLNQLPYYLEYLGDVVEPDLPTITAASASYSQTSGEITVDFESNGDFDRRLVMINSDDTLSTGYTGGFDYLLENGNLYNYIGDGTDWLWNALDTASGSTGDQAFDQVAQWSFGISNITVNAPVRFFIENDNLSASDELYSTITGVTIDPVVVGPFTPADSADKFANPDRGLYIYSTISISNSHLDVDTRFPLAEHRDDHEYCFNGRCGTDRKN